MCVQQQFFIDRNRVYIFILNSAYIHTYIHVTCIGWSTDDDPCIVCTCPQELFIFGGRKFPPPPKIKKKEIRTTGNVVGTRLTSTCISLVPQLTESFFLFLFLFLACSSLPFRILMAHTIPTRGLRSNVTDPH